MPMGLLKFFNNLKPEHWIALVSAITAIVSAIKSQSSARKSRNIADEANRLALDANRLSEEANKQAKEANDISRRSRDISAFSYLSTFRVTLVYFDWPACGQPLFSNPTNVIEDGPSVEAMFKVENISTNDAYEVYLTSSDDDVDQKIDIGCRKFVNCIHQ